VDGVIITSMFCPARVLAIAVCLAAMSAPTVVLGQQDLINQAHRLDLAGKPDAAIALYRQALEREADSFDAQYGIARALDLTGHYAEARRHFGKAIELAPDGVKDQALRMMGVSYVFTGDSARRRAISGRSSNARSPLATSPVPPKSRTSWAASTSSSAISTAPLDGTGWGT
jgi:tetratricopeptide (TPR) repeat protein